MAAFGTGLGADPLAAARTKEILARQAQTQRNIERMGEGQTPLGKGVGALSTVAGEHLGAAAAKLFGVNQGDSPEIAQAKQQAALLEQINALEGDRASSDFARRAGQLALDAGRQDLAFQFGQAAGERGKAEAKAAATLEEKRLDNLRQNFSAQTQDTKLSIIGTGNDDALNALGLPPGAERDKVVADAQASLKSNQIKAKAAADEVRRTLDPSVSATDVKAAQAYMTSANLGAEDRWNTSEDDIAAVNEAAAMRIAADGAQIMVDAQERGETISQADAYQIATDRMIESGAISVDVSPGKTFGMGKPAGYRSITGFGNIAAPAPQAEPATTPAGQGPRRVTIGK